MTLGVPATERFGARPVTTARQAGSVVVDEVLGFRHTATALRDGRTRSRFATLFQLLAQASAHSERMAFFFFFFFP